MCSVRRRCRGCGVEAWGGGGPHGRSVAAQEESVARRPSQAVAQPSDPGAVFHGAALAHVALTHNMHANAQITLLPIQNECARKEHWTNCLILNSHRTS